MTSGEHDQITHREYDAIDGLEQTVQLILTCVEPVGEGEQLPIDLWEKRVQPLAQQHNLPDRHRACACSLQPLDEASSNPGLACGAIVRR